MSRAFCRALQSAACRFQGYVMVGAPTSENGVNVVFSDEPLEKEGGEEEEVEEEAAKGKDKGKDKGKGKKGKNGADEPPPVEKVEEREINPLKAPTHVINLASSDEQLIEIVRKANTRLPTEGEEAETVDEEAVSKFKEELTEFRAVQSAFGQRPAVEDEEEKKEESEEKKEGEEKKDGEDSKEGGEDTKAAPEVEKTPATTVYGWMEEKVRMNGLRGCVVLSITPSTLAAA